MAFRNPPSLSEQSTVNFEREQHQQHHGDLGLRSGGDPRLQPVYGLSRPPPHSGRGSLLAALFFAGCTVLSGYLLWQLYRSGERQNGRIAVLETETEELRGKLDGAMLQRHHFASKSADLQQRLDTLQVDLAQKTGDLDTVRGELSTVAVYRDVMEEQLAEFREITGMFRKMIDAGKLDVEYRRGRMMLDLPDAVLFDSGSAELSADGLVTLRTVARTLRRVRGRRFIVAGHTDDVPVHTDRYPTNWELSSHRGVVVLRALLRFGVPASRIADASQRQREGVDHPPLVGVGQTSDKQRNRIGITQLSECGCRQTSLVLVEPSRLIPLDAASQRAVPYRRAQRSAVIAGTGGEGGDQCRIFHSRGIGEEGVDAQRIGQLRSGEQQVGQGA